jgi:hypothetical protein
MLPARQPERLAPSRAPWVVPLAFGVGGTLAIVFMILVGIGYDLVGRTPGPIVMTGLALLAAPMLYIARTNFRDYRGRKDLWLLAGQLSPELLHMLIEASRRHGDLFIEEAVVALLRQLDRRHNPRPITIKMLQLEHREVSDEDER